MMYKGLAQWCNLHLCFPENVLYYRDGVSESQYSDVLEKELSTIKNAFIQAADLFKQPVPEFKTTAVIVTKRHSTRFFPHRKDDAMPVNRNCKPGLLVDSAITSPYYTDFYLQSHNAIKGTARSSHYFVLKNEMDMEISDLEDLVSLNSYSFAARPTNDVQTHNLCHTYVRATTGVSYASPAYYADRLCERGRCYLREWFSPDGAKRDDYNTRRRAYEAQVEIARNRPQRPRNQKKTPAEIQEDKDDAEEVLKLMKENYIRDGLNKRWETLGDPVFTKTVHEQMYKDFRATMYWM